MTCETHKWAWCQQSLSAFTDPQAWKLCGKVLLIATTDESWHYVLVALAAWILLHVILKRRLARRLISKWPDRRGIARDVIYSLSTALIFGALNVLVLAMTITGHAEIYREPSEHGLVWLILSLPLIIVWHDAYFYWTHRLLHTRWLFKHVHAVHHRSRNPSPWSAYAFHPFEALNNCVMLLIPVATLPLNETVLMLFLLHQIVRNAHGHAAIETMPGSFVRHRFWGAFITTTHHHLHHERANGNYGLWFTWWDRWCSTERPEYLERFDKITARHSENHELPAPCKIQLSQ